MRHPRTTLVIPPSRVHNHLHPGLAPKHHRDALMLVLHATVLLYHLALAPEEPPGGHQALDSHGPARVDPPGADPHLRAKAVPEPVGEPTRAIMVHARRVH